LERLERSEPFYLSRVCDSSARKLLKRRSSHDGNGKHISNQARAGKKEEGNRGGVLIRETRFFRSLSVSTQKDETEDRPLERNN